MKNKFSVVMLLSIVGLFSNSAFALDAWATGKVLVLAADPSDVVAVLSQKGPCGSGYFHIQRKRANFKEFFSVAETAFTQKGNLTVHIVDCAGDRNITSHGWVD